MAPCFTSGLNSIRTARCIIFQRRLLSQRPE